MIPMLTDWQNVNQIGAFLRRWQTPILIAITLLAAAMRLVDLPNMPPGLHVDEAWAGENAREIIRTGVWPVFFPTNEGVEAMVVYLAVPLVALFGTPIWQLRIPEALAGTLTIPTLWWLCREWFGRRSDTTNPPSDDEYVLSSLLGLGGGLALAILFWHISMSRIGMEPILTPLFMCLAFAALMRALDSQRMLDFVLAGALLAGNLYTYKAGYAVPPLMVLFLIYLAIRDRQFLRRRGRNLAIMVAVALILYIPMIVYAATHPDEFFQRFLHVSVENRFTPPIDLWQSFIGTLGMFFVRGDHIERYNLPGRPALDPLMAILFVVGLIRAAGWLKNPRTALILLWLAVMSLPTLLSDFAPQWGRAIGTTPIIALLCALGGLTLWQLASRAAVRWLAPIALAGVGAIALLSGVLAARDYFVIYKNSDILFHAFDVGIVRISQHANATPPDQRVYIVESAPDYHTYSYIITRDFVVFNGRNGAVYPPPGQSATYGVMLQYARPMLKAMQDARPDSHITLDVDSPEGKGFAKALFLPAAANPAPDPSHRVEATLGDSIRLLGYDLSAETAKPGDKITITLYWRALAPVRDDYTVFVHLLGDQVSDSRDRQPIAATYPTSVWLPGETILDEHVIALPEDAPPGTYRLRIGMYLFETLERLLALSLDGQPFAENAIELGTITVAGK